MNYLMDKWRNQLEMWTAYTVLRKLRDILASFFFLLCFVVFLCQLLIFPLPPSASDLRQHSNNRPVSGQTKLGSISIHFQGATAAVRERVRVEKEWGVCMRGMVGEVWREPSQIWQWKKHHEYKKRWSCWINNLTVFLFFGSFLNLVLIIFWCFSVCSFSCFLFLFTASRGESSVFINREDTSVSVAVMHTGWALMKTDALSVEAEARGDSSQPSLLCFARRALMITRWDLFI